MPFTRIIAIGKIFKGNLQMEVAPPHSQREQRIAELQEFAEAEGIELPLPIDLILFLEDQDWIVDLRTGRATRPHAVGTHTPYGYAINYFQGEGAR